MRYLRLVVPVGLLLWTPLPFGSVTPWASTVLVVAVAAGLVLALTDRQAAEGLRPVATALAALFALGLLGLLQAYAGLSAAPGLSIRAGLGWWVVACTLALAALVSRIPGSRGALLAAAAVAAGFQALYGWRQALRAPGEIWGRAVAGPGPRLRGTFVNSDHVAILFEIGLAVAVGWAWWAWRRSRREPRFERRGLLLAPPWALWLICAAALVATGSRAALAAAALGVAAQIVLLFGVGRRGWIPLTLVALLAAGAWLAVTVGGPGRQLSTPLYDVANNQRFAVWGPAARVWLEDPWLGTGLGTFEEAFPAVETEELTRRRWGRAHNDPLELLMTGGVVAVGLLAIAVASLVRRLWLVRRLGGRSANRAAALAGLAALVPVGFHEIFDFGLTVPANAVLLTLLIGVAAAAPTATESGASPLPSRPALRPRAGSREGEAAP